MTEFLNQCTPFMLKEENLLRLGEVKNLEKAKNIYTIPKNSDMLFWCFHSFLQKDTFQIHDCCNIAEEKLLKIQYVEKLRKIKNILKSYKIASLSHVENMLANEKKIDIQTFLCLCLCENVPVILFKNKTYIELPLYVSDVSSVFTVKWFDGNKFGWKMEKDDEINKLKETHFRIENLEKPLRSISSYTVTDLLDICKKFDVSEFSKESGKKKTKAELYDSVLQLMPY